ncbi:MAG: DUF58 domain-containing protein [Verrucomicrobiota bacterium]
MPATEDAPKNYLDPRVLEHIKRLDLRARRVVEGFITGQHRSPYNGFAIEFAGHREYVPGDEIKHIDWKVWSKTDRLYIKEYETETNLKATLIVDCSKSMRYGREGWSKFDYASTAAASLAHLLQHQQDSVGLVTFDAKVRNVLPASSRMIQVKEIAHTLEATEPDKGTDVEKVFLKLAAQVRQRGIVAIFSDLLAETETIRDALERFRIRGHEVIVFHILDDDEIDFPFDENTRFVGLESTDVVQTDPRSLRNAYLEVIEDYLKEVRKVAASLGVDYTLARTSEPLDAVLSRYLAWRNIARRRG